MSAALDDDLVMPKLKPGTQQARREHILDQAELCFARAGFHRTTMQDICKEAGVSPGALYVYFPSKEALIAGIAERNRDKLADQLKHVSEAPDLMTAFDALAATTSSMSLSTNAASASRSARKACAIPKWARSTAP